MARIFCQIWNEGLWNNFSTDNNFMKLSTRTCWMQHFSLVISCALIYKFSISLLVCASLLQMSLCILVNLDLTNTSWRPAKVLLNHEYWIITHSNLMVWKCQICNWWFFFLCLHNYFSVLSFFVVLVYINITINFRLSVQNHETSHPYNFPQNRSWYFVHNCWNYIWKILLYWKFPFAFLELKPLLLF